MTTQAKRLTPEELMQPRIIVENDFWDNPFKVGDIIQFTQQREYHDFITGDLIGTDWLTDFLPNDPNVTRYMYWMRKFTPFPHLFRRIDWWEHRTPEEMPEYVKWVEVSPTTGSKMKELANAVEKVDDVINRGGWILLKVGSQINHIDPSYFIPATLQDYTQYINSLK